MIRQIYGEFQPVEGRIAIIASRFNDLIVEQLIKGATATCLRHGATEAQIDVISVPGAFELPFACQLAAKSGQYQGIIALGAVIRGSTPHFDYVAGECAKGLVKVSLDFNVPVTFGVLTVDTIDQALERAGTKLGNKGAEAAMALLEMINLAVKLHD